MRIRKFHISLVNLGIQQICDEFFENENRALSTEKRAPQSRAVSTDLHKRLANIEHISSSEFSKPFLGIAEIEIGKKIVLIQLS